MIPFGDLKRQHEILKTELERSFRRTLESGWFILGKQVEEFEENFAEYCENEYAVGVGNGTDALLLCLKAFGIGSGDEVITVANTAIPTCSAIVASGALPRLVDVGQDFLMDCSKVEEAITRNTRAIIPVHLYGQTCDMNTLIDVVKGKNIAIVEDCAQAHGAKYFKKKTPIKGLGCFSFYPSKNLGACGDGGMIVTDNLQIAEKLRLLRNYGQPKTYVSTIPGYNSRLDEVQAGILNVKLKHLERWNLRRREIAEEYNRELEGIVKTPLIVPGNEPIYHLYVIRTEDRDSLRRYLKENGIDTKVHYPVPIHLQPGFSGLGYSRGDFPNSERASEEILSLPMFPELEAREINKICKKIREWKRSKI